MTAGTSGKYWTPFKATAQALRDVVHAEPGIRLKDAVTKIQHHYRKNSIASASLAGRIRQKIIRGVRMKQDGRYLTLWPRDEAGNGKEKDKDEAAREA